MFNSDTIAVLRVVCVRSGFQSAPVGDPYSLKIWHKDEEQIKIGVAILENIKDASRIEGYASKEGVERSIVLDSVVSKFAFNNVDVIPIAILSYLSDTRFSNSKSIGIRLYPNSKFSFFRLSEPQEVWTTPRSGTILSFHPAPRGEYGFLEDDLTRVVSFFHQMDIEIGLPRDESLRGMSVVFEGRVHPLPREGKKQVARHVRRKV